MISLKQALKLCCVDDIDLVYIRTAGSGRRDGQWWTGRNIREHFDMKRTQVKRIDVRFAYEGDYEGFVFEICNENR